MKRILNENNKIFIGIFSVFIFIVIWELMSQFKVIDTLFTGTPLGILAEGKDLLCSQEFYANALSSFNTFTIGFSYAILFGVIGGLLIGANRGIYYFLKPYLFALNAIPPIVLMPLIIVWFGIGLTAKTAVVFLMAAIPIMISVVDASRTVDVNLVEMAHSFRASKIFMLRTITFFHTLPYIFSALRIAVGRAIIGVIVSEYFGFGIGLGYMISYNSSNFRIDRAMALILFVIVFNLVTVGFLNLLEKKIIKWKKD